MGSRRDSLRLAELLCTRLCHDLSSLLGTLDATLELAAEEPDPDGEAMGLARETAGELVHRLRYLRAAWGETGETLTLDGLKGLLRGLPRAERVAVDMSALPPGTVLAPAMARLLLNVLLLGVEGLPSGGRILLAGSAEDLFVRIAGPVAAWPGGLATCLADEAEAHAAARSARALQMPLTALLAHASGLRLSLLLDVAGTTEAAPLRLSRG
jgi:histidine phosphotransferase ChpT